MRELYISKVVYKPLSLIAKIELEVSVHCATVQTVPQAGAQCTDTPNFIFAIKQGALETTFEIYNSLIAQLA